MYYFPFRQYSQVINGNIPPCLDDDSTGLGARKRWGGHSLHVQRSMEVGGGGSAHNLRHRVH